MKKNILILFTVAIFFVACDQFADNGTSAKDTTAIDSTAELQFDEPADGYKNETEKQIDSLIKIMTLREKIGQLCQLSCRNNEKIDDKIKVRLQNGLAGSFLNAEGMNIKYELQRIAVEESRLKIPLLFARDVIHGFRTVFPIPLGQAATWNPAIVKKAAGIAATEAASTGIHWTFAPMVDISRDPRWGRIAESLGEDPYLASKLAAAMVQGFQGKSLADANTIAACAKHYVGYGAAEGGRDYNSAWIPEIQLRNVYLKPFKSANDAGVATLMSAFQDLNGVPASGNYFTIRQILKQEWNFNGFVVSDSKSIQEMINHGYCKDDKEAAFKAIYAGVDMEMVSETYLNHLEELVEEEKIAEELIDDAVRRVLRIKFKLGLFDNPYIDVSKAPVLLTDAFLETAKQAAMQSIVMLKNQNNALPLSPNVKNIAVIGPLADSPYDQMGCWVLDGKKEDVQTPLSALKSQTGDSIILHYAKGLENTRTKDNTGFAEAVAAAQKSEVALLFVGEESMLSGEARNRAFIDLPGAQNELIQAIAKTGKPIVLIIMAGRPLTFSEAAKEAKAILYAWHPGTMGGSAIVDLLFGIESPSGKLPVTFPRTIGQIPLYYAHRNTGRPPGNNQPGIPKGTPQEPKGYTSKYIDVDFTPEYPFGYGLSYTDFEYKNLKFSYDNIKMNDAFEVSVEVINTGKMEADEIVQLYIRDFVGSITRPVKELKGFQRVRLKPEEKIIVSFKLHTNDLAFYNSDLKFAAEPGKFQIWIGPNSQEGLTKIFEINE